MQRPCCVWLCVAMFVVLLALAGSQQLAQQPPLCQRLPEAGTIYHSVYMCLGVPSWALVPALWTPLSIQVNCTAPTYEIFVADSWDALHDDPQPVRWCGLVHFTQPEECMFTLSPFEDVYVAIKTRQTSLFGMIGSTVSTEPQCSFAARRDLSLAKVAMAVLGIALFTHAHALTASSTFRLGAGTLTFMSGAALVLVFILMRSMPHKRKLAAAFAVSASSVMGVLRWVYGTWAPDLVGLLTSRATVIYFLVTGLLGLGVTYWMDDVTNVKLNNTVNVVLHLAGLLLVYMGTTSEPASLAIIALLAASRILAPVARRLPGAWLWLRTQWAALMAARAKKARAAAAMQLTQVESVVPSAGKQRQRRGGVRADAAGELLLSEDEEREAEEEIRRLRLEQQAKLRREQELELQRNAQLEQPSQATATQLHKIGSLNAWLNGGVHGQVQRQQHQQLEQQQTTSWEWPSRRLATQQQSEQEEQQQAAAAATGAAAGGWFSRWSNAGGEQAQRAAAPVAGATAAAAPVAPPAPRSSPLHLRTPPPDPSKLQQEKQQQEQQQQQQRGGRQQQRNRGLYEDSECSSDEEQEGRSPWSQERLVVDIRTGSGGKRTTPTAAGGGGVRGATAAAAPAAAAARSSGAARRSRPVSTGARQQGAAAAAEEEGEGGRGGGGDVSPLVAMGKIFNAESSRVIQIGKGKYEELVAKGYTPDFKNGVLLPPGDAGAGASSGRAAAVSGGTKQRTPRTASRRG